MNRGLPRRRRIVDLEGSEYVIDKLLSKGLSLDRAVDVLNGAPKFDTQPETNVPDESGRDRIQPERLIMVRPDRGGRILTFVLEHPDPDRVSQVVTGWISGAADISGYAQGGGMSKWQNG